MPAPAGGRHHPPEAGDPGHCSTLPLVDSDSSKEKVDSSSEAVSRAPLGCTASAADLPGTGATAGSSAAGCRPRVTWRVDLDKSPLLKEY